ncbi:restriction endonuclease [Streptomyces sp. SID8352]|uniref:restriction endonuclease n=1 Tax=Streptomyces sp. SID8352 TaxID=2690338 RepID=UPI0031F6B83E
MTVPEYRTRRLPAGRRFDLRATAMFFALAAAGLVLVGLVARTALGVAQRRPGWAVVLVLGAVWLFAVRWRGRRRPAPGRLARRTTSALATATDTAMDAWREGEGAVADRPDPVAPAGGDAVTTVDHEALSPEAFERAIAGLCARDGCSAMEVVGGAGDLGADVLAVAPDGRRLVVQCKRYGGENKVGSEELQRFGGTCFTVHEADVAVLVTTGGITAPAAEYAERCGIVCVDGEGLRAWTEGTGPEPWADRPAGQPW